MREYQRSLYRYFWRRLAPITVANNLILGYLISGTFFDRGVFPHPWLDLFAIAGCACVDVIALVAMWEISAYINPWRRP